MASGTKTSHNFYQNTNVKYGAMPPTQKDAEVTHDMHLKMSKKIAQLTKVIYALNTKNDEHEAVVQSIKGQHEEELQQLLAETKAKVELYKAKVMGEMDYKKKTETLENRIRDYEEHKKQAHNEFESYKHRCEARELELKKTHSNKMLELSQELLGMKKNFEEKLKGIDGLKQKYERDKAETVEGLKKEYEEKMKQLQDSQELNKNALNDTQKSLQEKYENEVEKLKQQCDELVADRKKVVEEYEQKLSKAQAFYDKELQALRSTQESSHQEQVLQLHEEIEKLKKDLSFQEAQQKKRVDELISKLSLSEDEVDRYKQELEKLHAGMESRDSQSQVLSSQLRDAKTEAAEALQRLREVETELVTAKERCSQQAADLIKKSATIGELEASHLQHESQIKDLNTELSKLQDRLKWMQNEKQSLENKNQSQTKEQFSQLKTLEKALEDMSIEKQMLRDKYEKDIRILQDQARKHEDDMRHAHQGALDDLRRLHRDEMESQLKKSEADLQTLRQDLQNQFHAEKTKLEQQHSTLTAEYENMKAELMLKLTQAQEDIQRLEMLVQNSEQGLGSATALVTGLKDQIEKLKVELDSTREDLRHTKNKSSSLQDELGKLKATHETKLKEADEELRHKLSKQARELEEKWTDNLRKECIKLRHELTAQKEEDKRAALEQLTKLKEEEMAATRDSYQTKINELLQQISELKANLESKQSSISEEFEAMKQKAEEENRRLMQEMLQSAEDYAKKIEMMEKLHKDQLQQLEERKAQEAKDLEKRLQERHMEEIQAQTKAHKITVESLKDAAERTKVEELEALRQKHVEKMDSLKNELQRMHGVELEQQTRSHAEMMQAARMELERAMELARQKEAEHGMKVAELEEAVRHRQMHSLTLEEEIRKLQHGIDDLTDEIEAKSKETLRVQSEANRKLKQQEQKLREQHKASMEELQAHFMKESQENLAQFNEAQEMLKDKISALQIMLEEAEDRYRNRDSRPEDLERIAQVEKALLDNQELMQRLLDEKKYYQMELVNRETNFNKVFNANPQVGLLNPLVVKKKGKNQSAPSLNVGTRLNPLPGSPIHHERINPNNPLPPMKKFVR